MEIGSIVECINASGINTKSKCVIPKKGRLYTVTGFVQKPRGMGIYIEECSDMILVNYGNRKKRERAPFLQSRFMERLPPMKIEAEEEIFQEL